MVLKVIKVDKEHKEQLDYKEHKEHKEQLDYKEVKVHKEIKV